MQSKVPKSRHTEIRQKRGKPSSQRQNTTVDLAPITPRVSFHKNKLRDSPRGHSPLKKSYEPFDFTENNDTAGFLENIGEIDDPLQSLRREINEWKRQEMMSDKVKRKLQTLTIPEPPKLFDADEFSSTSLPTNCAVGEREPVGDKMELGKTDCGVNTQENIKSIEDYLENHSRMSLEMLRKDSMGSDTLEAILNAERLVQEAKRVIAETRRRAIHSKTVSEGCPIMHLTEEELEIKSLVFAKFDEANGRTLRTKLGSLPPNPPHHPQEVNPPPKTLSIRTKTPSIKTPTTPRLLPSGSQPPSSIEIQRGPRVDIRNNLSFTKMSPLDIHPCSLPSRPNTGTFQLRHVASKRVTIDEPTSLIDAGVQTSLRDSSKIPMFEERDAPSRSGPSDLDQNKIDGSNEVRHAQVTGDNFGGGKIDGEGLRAGAGVTHSPTSKNEPKRLGANTFIDFLFGMNALDAKKSEKETPGDCENSPSSPMSLTAPDTSTVDRLLDKVDEKLKTITRKTKTLDQLGAERDRNKNLEVADGLIKEKNSECEVEVLLKPRFRFSSSSSVASTETLPSARLSTPLNNTMDASIVHIRSRMDQRARAVVTSAAVSDSDNVGSYVIDGIVPMTRNELLYDKNNKAFGDDKPSPSEESATNGTDETVSLFPTYSSDKSADCGVQRSERSLRMNRDSVNHEIKIMNVESFRIDNDITGGLRVLPGDEDNKGNEGHSEQLGEISGDVENEEHQVCGSSVREGTSQDISKLSSEIVGGSGDERRHSSRILEGNGGGGKNGGDEDECSQEGRLRLPAGYSEKDLVEKSSKSSISHEGISSVLLGHAQKDSGVEKKGLERDGDDGCQKAASEKSGEDFRKNSGEGSSPTSSVSNEDISSALTRHSLSSDSSGGRRKGSKSEKEGPEGTGEGCEKTLGKRNFFRRSISHKGISSTSSRHSSTCGSSDGTRKSSMTDCYSEGELFVSSSCGHSLGEVVGSSRSGGVVNKIRVNLLASRTSLMTQGSAESPGELLDTDIDSNSSFTSRGWIA
ncbi:uncharacterized protein LOC135162073 isoform X2 [Diachasmimorpha longicaudata]|uniref:uncharacterized protein LOC135162073 isoform X2 n=1 Tax=Diachasmimorpha longicaudata TaxID=58733 RepID=UPI0030B886DB